jgi:vacuolar protein sorting-associated protein 54
MRSAGLKNITAKHLALASQSLSIVIALIPYIREALRRHLSAKQAVMLTEFDKLKRDFQEHQYEIHAKFVAIINDRLLVHCKALREIDWTVDRPAGSSANPYMETLVKETTMLHKVLAKYLHGPTLDQVIGQVLSDVNARLAEEYGKIELRDVAARDRMLVDARYLQTKLAELKGLTRPTPGQVRGALAWYVVGAHPAGRNS